MFFIDPIYLIIVVGPVLLVGGLATLWTKVTFKRYSRISASRGFTGAEAAEHMLHSAGVTDCSIETTGGFLGDHYNPMTRTLKLSRDVYGSRSLSAIGIACHEAGHAIQHARRFAPLHLRTGLVPLTNLCSQLYIIPIIAGFLMHSKPLAIVGLAMCAMSLVFALITLPVEWDASRRAKRAMVEGGMMSEQEANHAGKVLNAAFMTYIAAVVSALLVLLYWAIRLGLLGGRSD
jgi:Zn-dependent membrane protease YugP